MAESIDTGIKVNTEQLAMALPIYIEMDEPVMVWGPPGVGKSAVVFQIGEKLKRPVLDIRLGLMDPTDLKGVPYYDADTKSLKWAPSAELPRSGQGLDNAILFLDEINGSPQSVQGAAYQLIHNRRLGEYILPENVRIIAAGNNDTDRGVTYKMPKPLANRFSHLDVTPDFACFQKWAYNNDIHPDVIGYLSSVKHHSFVFDPKSQSKAFATYRTWEKVSKLTYRQSKIPDSHVWMAMVAGAVGEGIAGEYLNHLKIGSQIPLAEDVLSGKVEEMNTKEISAHYTMVFRLCYELREIYRASQDPSKLEITAQEWNEATDRFYGFIHTQFSAEMAILAAQIVIKDYDLPYSFNAPNLIKFSEKYGKYIDID